MSILHAYRGTAALMGMALAVAACAAPRSGPLVPSAIERTPAALLAGTAGLPTPLASTTPTAPGTRWIPPPEPLDVPEGFTIGVFADQLGPVGGLARAPNGDVFVTVPAENRVLVLPDRDSDGVADQHAVFAEGAGLNLPHGLAFVPGALYVANTDGVVRYPYGAGELQAQGPGEMVLPLPAGGAVWRRTLVRAGDGSLYVSVGASCDACDETDPRRAAVLRHEDGRPLLAFSVGLRGVGGLAIEPRTGGLWATDQGRGDLGDQAPPEELNLLAAGGHFGWPRCYGARTPDASQQGSPTGCAATLAPAVSFGPRTEPMGLVFGHGARLPPEWRDDLFVALHGASTGFPVGFKVVRVPFAGGVPAGEAVDFVAGWLRPDTRRWGRPIDVMVAADGALLIADEGGHRVYRLGYEPATPVPTPVF